MSELIYEEMTLLVACFFLGMILGLFYDGFRILRLFIRHKDWLVDVEDLVFWVVTAWLVFKTLFCYNQGILRAYAFLGIMIGLLLYYLSVSKIIFCLARKIVPVWSKVLELIKKPVVLFGQFLQKTLKNMIADVKMALKGR